MKITSDQALVPLELLSPREMADADRLTMESGQSGEALMRAAARAVVDQAAGMNSGRVAVLAGAGNNGGDAYGAAAMLRAEGHDVTLYALGARDALKGDAATMAREWGTTVAPLETFSPGGFALVVDGLFGAGLSRPVEGVAADAIGRLNAGRAQVLSIDLPSGVDGADGQARGAAVRADATVTFFARKPGHLLLPGRSLCGRLHVADIGIRPGVVETIRPRAFANEPELFRDVLLVPEEAQHKYDRGHAVVFSGGATRTGAARLSAMAALRGGAGLVTLASPASALLVNAAHLTAVMLRRCEDDGELAELLEDGRLKTFVLGPGFGDLAKARAFAVAILRAGRRLVLDADGLTAFAGAPDELFDAGPSETLVLTPHDGEFQRLFPDLAQFESKLDRARKAAERSGAVVALKGADTVIAAPDGRVAIDASGTPALATAGSGDVLAGLVAARLANGTPVFEAACAAVWLHGTAANAFGPGLIAEDLPGLVPAALRALEKSRD